MLRRITVEKFRGFSALEVAPLARVNLLVGANNAGKTGVLEAAELIEWGADPTGIFDVLARREEYALDHQTRSDRSPYDVRGLFHGRNPALGESFVLSGHNTGTASVQCTLRLLEEEELRRAQIALPLEPPPKPLAAEDDLLALHEAGVLPLALELVSNGHTSLFPLTGRYFGRLRHELAHPAKVRFLGTSLFSPTTMASLWDEVALTPREEQVVETLRIIEPTVQRVAVLSGARKPMVYLQLAGQRQRVPLGSMGEGMKRLFALALAIGNTPRDGLLLIDEVDTGLHHTVMAQMWQLVLESSQALGFQAFFTTHSLDCLLALARVLGEHPKHAKLVALHRLERDRPTTTHFVGDELRRAIESELEVR